MGAAATQSFVNPFIGLREVQYLASGLDAQAAMERLAAEDEGRNVGQFSVVDAHGRAAAYSGADCVGWFGHRTGDGYAVAGNMLVGEPTIVEMARAFEASAAEHLAKSLGAGAGSRAGGGRR